MSMYTVHEPPQRFGAAPEAERFAFVRDGFSFWAFLFAPLWMLRHRMWLVLIGYVLILGGLETVVRMFGGSVLVGGGISFLVSLLVGLEAGTLRRFTLTAAAGTMSASSAATIAKTPSGAFSMPGCGAPPCRPPHRPRVRPPPMPRMPQAPDVIGLFPEPGAPVTVAIVDYGSGNLHSAAKAFERAAHESGRGQPIVVTKIPPWWRDADRVVLPGVGAFADCRRGLDAVDGMVEALEEAVRRKGRPFFGICVGMQLLAERGREYEVTEGLGWIAGEVDRIAPSDPNLKIPHMGWNTLNVARAASAARRTGASARRAGTPISCTPISSIRRSAAIWWRMPIMAAPSPRSWRATISSARNFIPRRARKLGLALIANFLKWKPS